MINFILKSFVIRIYSSILLSQHHIIFSLLTLKSIWRNLTATKKKRWKEWYFVYSWISYQLFQFPNRKCHIFPTIRWCLWFIVLHFKFYQPTTLRLVRSGRNKTVTQRIFTKRNQRRKECFKKQINSSWMWKIYFQNFAFATQSFSRTWLRKETTFCKETKLDSTRFSIWKK